MNDGGTVDAQGWLEAGIWTVEIRRPLKSTGMGNIALEPGSAYNFGFAIHDDFTDARFHHVSLGYKLALDNDQAELNAVKAQVSATVSTTTAPQKALASPSGDIDSGVDWSKAGERQITLFYPGQTSMEWTLVGKYHGG
ncbi:MAG: ethylbenzene dehydrogenase-related protein, partial [Candidatus Thiodiazotropha sp. 6PDIVS]